jgi:peptidoglycan/LPS O-acetylase OafA/YrhL
MNSFLSLIVVAIVAVVVYGLFEPWRQRRRWQRHRDKQNRDIDREMRPQ